MIKQIAVIGRGMPLAMTTAILAQSLRSFGTKVFALELPNAQRFESEVEVCGTEFSPLCRILGLNEQKLISECRGTFRLGNLLSDEQSSFIPFGYLGISAQQDDFELGLFQHLQSNGNANLSEWSAASSAALAGKFAIAGNNRPELQEALAYGVNLDKRLYLSNIKALCDEANVQWVKLQNEQCDFCYDELGYIQELVNGGQKYTADFWLDLGSTSNVVTKQERSNWQASIPLTHKSEWQSNSVVLSKPFTDIQKFGSCWLKTTCLRDKTFYQLFVNNNPNEPQTIEQQIAGKGIQLPANIDWQPIQTGALTEAWQANCLKLGSAAIELSGLVLSELQCLQAALVLFMDLFPDIPIGKENRRNFNRMWQRFVQDAHDYTAAHFLHSCSDVSSLPVSLQQRLQVFGRLGRISALDSDAVSESQWYHLLYGIGYRPQLSSVLLSKIDDKSKNSRYESIRLSIKKLVEGMPTHQQYLYKFYSS